MTRVDDRNAIFGTDLHARHIQDVDLLLGVGLFDRLFQLCEGRVFLVAFQFLLALLAGQDQAAIPRRRVRLQCSRHRRSMHFEWEWKS